MNLIGINYNENVSFIEPDNVRKMMIDMDVTTKPHHHTESGNVLIYILIAVILFAALSFAFTQTQQGGQGAQSTLSEGKASLSASQIIDFASDIDKAISQMQTLSNCEDTEISFDYASGNDAFSADYDHAGSRKACKVFNTAGGSMTYNKPRSEWFASSATDEDWAFNEAKIDNVGTSKNELLIHLRDVKEDICKKLNAELDVNDGGSPPTNSNDLTQSLFVNGSFDNGNAAAGITGETAGCVEQTSSNSGFHFYKVLITR